MRKIKRIRSGLLFIIGCILVVACANQKKVEGVSFTELNTGTDASFRGLSVVDENTVWASGSAGTVLL